METLMAELAIVNNKVARLEERVYENHDGVIEESREDIKSINRKFTVLLFLLGVGCGLNILATWPKIVALLL